MTVGSTDDSETVNQFELALDAVSYVRASRRYLREARTYLQLSGGAAAVLVAIAVLAMQLLHSNTASLTRYGCVVAVAGFLVAGVSAAVQFGNLTLQVEGNANAIEQLLTDSLFAEASDAARTGEQDLRSLRRVMNSRKMVVLLVTFAAAASVICVLVGQWSSPADASSPSTQQPRNVVPYVPNPRDQPFCHTFQNEGRRENWCWEPQWGGYHGGNGHQIQHHSATWGPHAEGHQGDHGSVGQGRPRGPDR
jgi:hypothetical protein